MSTPDYRSNWEDLPSSDGPDGPRVPRTRRSPAFGADPGADQRGPEAWDAAAAQYADPSANPYDPSANPYAAPAYDAAGTYGGPAGHGSADPLDNLDSWTQLQGNTYGEPASAGAYADPAYPAYAEPAAALPAQPAAYDSSFPGGGYGDLPTDLPGSSYPATGYDDGVAPTGYAQPGSYAPQDTYAPHDSYAPQDSYAAPETYAAAPASYLPAPPVDEVAPSGRQLPQTTALLAESEVIEEALPQRVHAEAKVTKSGLVLADLLHEVLERKASDLHLTVDSQPLLRVRGELVRLEEYPTLNGEMIQEMMYGVLTQRQRETFEEHLELDMAYALGDHARFRVNLYKQKNVVGSAMRLIPYEIKPLEDLGVPASVAQFASLPRGFVLVTGPTGSGKSTTLASLIDLANRTRKDHILTVEDPIEFVHEHKQCIVNQREVGEDTHSFAQALKHALRQDPDIILVGELLRDLETIGVALTAAETGHLVFATLHTQNAPQTVERIIDVYPAHQQEQVRAQLAGCLQGVVTQTLCKTADGSGRAVATEVMVATPGIRNLIREGKTHQIHSSMQAGASYGMHTLDQHLAELVKTGKVAYETALEKCTNPSDLERLLGRG